MQTGGIRVVFYFEQGVAKVFTDLQQVNHFLFGSRTYFATAKQHRPDWSADALAGKLDRVVLGVSKRAGSRREEGEEANDTGDDFIGMYKTLPSITFKVV